MQTNSRFHDKTARYVLKIKFVDISHYRYNYRTQRLVANLLVYKNKLARKIKSALKRRIQMIDQ
jgi:hypothetical protein